MATEIRCVVLAAGQSTRFGSDKLMHILPSGQTVLQQTIQNCLSAFSELTVVVNTASEPLIDSIAPLVAAGSVRLIYCPEAEQGMSASLKAAVSAHPRMNGWLIALGDMPYIQPNTLVKLADAIEPDIIVQPVFGQQAGNPVGFGRNFYPELMAVQGDVGGKGILSRNTHNVVQVDTQDRGVLHDIDTPDQVLSR